MRYHEPLNHVLDSKVKVICLRFLCHTPAEMNGTQLAKLVGISVPTVHKSLKELFEERVVIMRTIGNNHLYEINKSNSIVTQILLPMFNQEHKLADVLVENIKKLVKESPYYEKIISVALFGSVQEGKERSNSDIDLLLVVKDAKDAKNVENIFFDGKNKILRQIPTQIEPFVKTVSQFLREKNNGIIKAIFKSHSLILGKRLEEVAWSRKA